RSVPAPSTLAAAFPVPGPRRRARIPASDSNAPQARAGRARRADGTPARPRLARRPAADAAPYPELGRSLRGSLGGVFVVAADPQLPSLALIASFGRSVKDPVVGHQELHSATGRRVGLVADPVLQGEGREAEQFGEVAVDVGAGCLGITERDWGQLV